MRPYELETVKLLNEAGETIDVLTREDMEVIVNALDEIERHDIKDKIQRNL